MMRSVSLALACLLAMLAGGCASTPETRYYELQATATRTGPTRALPIAVDSVAIPPDVDRPQFVLSATTDEVAIDDFHRWAAPLRDELALVVSRDLAALLGSDEVALPGEGGAAPRYRVQIEIRAFRSRIGDSAELDAGWYVRRDDGLLRTGHSTIRVPVKEPGFDALANAHSVAVERLSGEIAEAILALDREPLHL
jgi:uncharacterized protein